MKIRSKPVVKEAIQFTGTEESAREIVKTFGPSDLRVRFEEGIGQLEPQLQIHTLEGLMIASPGDWIIRGLKNELYPCKPDIFDNTYERLE